MINFPNSSRIVEESTIMMQEQINLTRTVAAQRKQDQRSVEWPKSVSDEHEKQANKRECCCVTNNKINLMAATTRSSKISKMIIANNRHHNHRHKWSTARVDRQAFLIVQLLFICKLFLDLNQWQSRVTSCEAAKLPDIYWNSSNPM